MKVIKQIISVLIEKSAQNGQSLIKTDSRNNDSQRQIFKKYFKNFSTRVLLFKNADICICNT